MKITITTTKNITYAFMISLICFTFLYLEMHNHGMSSNSTVLSISMHNYTMWGFCHLTSLTAHNRHLTAWSEILIFGERYSLCTGPTPCAVYRYHILLMSCSTTSHLISYQNGILSKMKDWNQWTFFDL